MALDAVNGAYREFLTRGEASKYIIEVYRFACSAGYLARLASIGGGPVRHRSGKSVVYRKTDLDAWALARLRRVDDHGKLENEAA